MSSTPAPLFVAISSAILTVGLAIWGNLGSLGNREEHYLGQNPGRQGDFHVDARPNSKTTEWQVIDRQHTSGLQISPKVEKGFTWG
jgi:hypothetical protein